MTTQPEALRLATVLENKLGGAADEDIEQAAAELRRLHEVNQELLEALNCGRADCIVAAGAHEA